MQKIKLNRNPDDKLLLEAYKDFIYTKKVEKKAIDTISYYNRCYNSFTRFLNESPDMADKSTTLSKADYFKCSEFNNILILEYTEWLMDSEEPVYSEHTINTLLRGIRTLINFCIENGYTQYFKVKMIKVSEVMKETYTEKELAILLKKPNLKKVDLVEYRTWVMENAFYGSGQRISTLLDFKISQIDFETKMLNFRNNKNRKMNPVPLSDELEKIIKEYIHILGLKNDDYLFCNQFGEQLKRRSAQDCIADYNKAHGISKTSAHLFRHTYAKDWILNGGDIFRLQAILGHSSLEVVKMYVRLFASDLKVDYDKFSPLDNMKKKMNIQEKQKIKTRTKE